jgi:hypothetical protein
MPTRWIIISMPHVSRNGSDDEFEHDHRGGQRFAKINQRAILIVIGGLLAGAVIVFGIATISTRTEQNESQDTDPSPTTQIILKPAAIEAAPTDTEQPSKSSFAGRRPGELVEVTGMVTDISTAPDDFFDKAAGKSQDRALLVVRPTLKNSVTCRFKSNTANSDLTTLRGRVVTLSGRVASQGEALEGCELLKVHESRR